MITKYVFKKSDFYTNKGGVEYHWARYKVFFKDRRYRLQLRTNLETERTEFKVTDDCGYVLRKKSHLEKDVLVFWLAHLEGNVYDSV